MARKMTRPVVDVSVIIAAWKAADSLERSVASALASTGVRIEVIVIDDASPDATMDVLRQLAAADDRVIAERLPVNAGPSSARNRAIELATGRYIAILDADDTIAPGRLATLVALAERSGADIAVDNMIVVDETGQPIGDQPFLDSTLFTRAHDIDLAEWVRFNQPLRPGDCLGYLKPLIRRAALSDTGARYDENLRNSEDYHLVAQMLAAGARMIYTPEAGYHYQRSAGSTSHRLKPQQTRAILDAEERFQARYANKLSKGEVDLLRWRQRSLRSLHQFVSAVEAIKTGRPATLARLLVSDMRASVFTMSTFAKIALGKALGRPLV